MRFAREVDGASALVWAGILTLAERLDSATRARFSFG